MTLCSQNVPMPQKYTQRSGSRQQTKQSSKLSQKCWYAPKAQKISTKSKNTIPRRTTTEEMKRYNLVKSGQQSTFTKEQEI
jgi:hypothetical protein